MIFFLTGNLEIQTITINLLWQCFKGRKRYEPQDGVSAGHVHHGAASKIFDAPADTCDLSSGSLKSGTKSNDLNTLDLSKNRNDPKSEFKLSYNYKTFSIIKAIDTHAKRSDITALPIFYHFCVGADRTQQIERDEEEENDSGESVP